MEIKKLEINKLTHQIYTWGDPTLPKLFLIHGWMDTAASFHFICQELQKKFYCIAPDLRGFGHSEGTSSPLGYFIMEYVADVHELFRLIAPDEKIRMIGHSMGGNILSLYAGAFPEKISHFVNLEGIGIQDTSPEEMTQKVSTWITQISSPSPQKKYNTEEEIFQKIQKNFPNVSDEKLKWILPFLTRKTEQGWKFAADPKHKYVHPYAYHFEDVKNYLKKIQAKCLIMLSEKTDPFFWYKMDDPMAEVKKRIEPYPEGTETFIVSDSGHMMHLEQPEKVSKRILDWFTNKY